MISLAAPGHTWRVEDPGGRLGRRLRTGQPDEHALLDEIRARGFTGSAIDVGAHMGNHALYLAIVCGLTVHAFEPDPERLDALHANVALNADGYPDLAERVHTYPYAAGRRRGGAFWKQGRYRALDDSKGGPVPVVPIDDVLDLDDVSVVKVDVEGMEADALAGMARHLLRCRPVVYTEVHGHAAHDAQQRVLGPLGYRQVGELHETRALARMERWEAP